MRWLQNIPFSHASSSPLSHSSSSSPKAPPDLAGPKLTRQRNLRYLSEREITGALHIPEADTPAGASPQPLPLPEFTALFQRPAVGVRGSRLEKGDCPLPSPKQAAGPLRDGAAEGSAYAHRDKKSVLETVEARPSRRVCQDGNAAESSQDSSFKINIPVRSAPTSPLASPILSPPRLSSGDFFPYYYITPKANNIWSAPEMPTGVPLPTIYPDYYTTFSSESSPLQSPQMRSPLPMYPDYGSSRSSSGLSPISWRDSNSHSQASVHPLPLPPGAAILSPTSGNSHVSMRADSLPLKSKWQKGKIIGRGTFGSVYVATNLETGALCAMKEVELYPDDPKSVMCMKQLEQEIKVLSQLKHPNIVQYYGSEIIEDRFYIYLEYVHPGSINKYVREHCGAITESVVRSFTRHILSGLAYLHSKKTIHRDIKGANLLVDASGVVKLADFGMAKHLSGQASDLSLKGSPYWMAPELMNSVMQKDSTSDDALAVDIWSLGCTIIEMLTGRPPWSEYEGVAAMFKILKDTPPIPENLSPEGKDFLQHCFRRNPAERPSAAMLLEHRFIKSPQLQDNPSCSCSRQASTGIKLADMPLSPRQHRPKTAIDNAMIGPRARSVKVNMTFDGENGRQAHHRVVDVAVPSRKSPRSILEPLPSLSPPYSDGSTNDRSTPNPSSLVNPDHMKHQVFR